MASNITTDEYTEMNTIISVFAFSYNSSKYIRYAFFVAKFHLDGLKSCSGGLKSCSYRFIDLFDYKYTTIREKSTRIFTSGLLNLLKNKNYINRSFTPLLPHCLIQCADPTFNGD